MVTILIPFLRATAGHSSSRLQIKHTACFLVQKSHSSILLSYLSRLCVPNRSTSNLKEYHQHSRISGEVSAQIPEKVEVMVKTDAAAAAKLSKGLATVVNAIRPRNSTIKPVITPSLFIVPWVMASTHSGAISIIIPRIVIVTPTNASIRASEAKCSASGWGR